VPARADRSEATAALQAARRRPHLRDPDNRADPASWTVEALTALRDRCTAQGIALDMVEFPVLSSASIDRPTPRHDMLRDPKREIHDVIRSFGERPSRSATATSRRCCRRCDPTTTR
jgi:hypothetical protein